MPAEFFDVINNIMSDPARMTDEQTEGNPMFVIRRSLINAHDLVPIANFFNARNVPDRALYCALHSAVPKRFRRTTWPKKQKIDEIGISIIAEYYNCSKREAASYANLLDSTDIEYMSGKLSKGGLKAGTSKVSKPKKSRTKKS